MKLLTYHTFISEKENVKIQKKIREYVLTHMSDDKFQLKSDNFYKEFKVSIIKKELILPLTKVYNSLIDSIESMKIEDLYKNILKAESIPFDYSKVLPNNFSLKEIPDFLTSLTDEQRIEASDEKSFLSNSFSSLNSDIKNSIIENLRERAEIYCVVIEAFFYFIRINDKDEYFNNMNSSEIIDELQKAVEKSSKEVGFSFTGPYGSNENEIELTSDSNKAYWWCEKDMKKFKILATISPKELHNEINIGITKGLKFSLIKNDENDTSKSFSYFDINELSSRIKEFYNSKIKNIK